LQQLHFEATEWWQPAVRKAHLYVPLRLSLGILIWCTNLLQQTTASSLTPLSAGSKRQTRSCVWLGVGGVA
jgi:hypothetical protein